MPFAETCSRGNRPAPLAALETIQIAAKMNTGWPRLVDAGEDPVRFRMRRIPIQLACVIGHDMVSGTLMFRVISERPLDELRRAADKDAMVVDGVRVIHG